MSLFLFHKMLFEGVYRKTGKFAVITGMRFKLVMCVIINIYERKNDDKNNRKWWRKHFIMCIVHLKKNVSMSVCLLNEEEEDE